MSQDNHGNQNLVPHEEQDRVLQESLARPKVVYLEVERAKRVGNSLGNNQKEPVLPKLKEHWENSFRAFDKIEQTHADHVDRKTTDAVEVLRTDLDKRLRQALIGLVREQSRDRSR